MLTIGNELNNKSHKYLEIVYYFKIVSRFLREMLYKWVTGTDRECRLKSSYLEFNTCPQLATSFVGSLAYRNTFVMSTNN